jgi:diguanylate cyclase (GGDEF)-like protein
LLLRRIARHGARLSSRRDANTELAGCAYINLAIGVGFSLAGYLAGRQADRLAILSETDPLTGLHNARSLWKRLRQEIARSRRYHAQLALLFVDLDQLKQVNDVSGHRAGDQALRQLAEAIRTELRATDLGARWGGDEFAIVAPNTSAASARALAERVRSLAAQRLAPWRTTASIGIATLDPNTGGDDCGAEALTQAVDVALYQAKQLGGNSVIVGGGIPSSAKRRKSATAEGPAPFGELERSLIEQFVQERGYEPRRLRNLTETDRAQLLAGASVFASGRLAEVESRAHFVQQLS